MCAIYVVLCRVDIVLCRCGKYFTDIGLHGYGVDTINHFTGQGSNGISDISESLVDGRQRTPSFGPAIISEVDGTLLRLGRLNFLGSQF